MSFFKKHMKKLKDGRSSPGSSEDVSGTESPSNGTIPRSNTTGSGNRKSVNFDGISGSTTPDERRRSQEVVQADRVRKSIDKERRKVDEKKRLELARIESAVFMEEGPEEMTKLYRPFSMNQSKRRTHENRILLKQLNFAGMCQTGFLFFIFGAIANTTCRSSR